jgi:hypothetical protein
LAIGIVCRDQAAFNLDFGQGSTASHGKAALSCLNIGKLCGLGKVYRLRVFYLLFQKNGK